MFFLIRFVHKNAGRGSPAQGDPGSAVRIPASLATCNKARAFALALAVAETQGFEPWRGFIPYLVSSEALSTTQPRLRFSLT